MAAGAPIVWDEWGRITRFLEGARLAFARESDLWESLQIGAGTRIAVSTGHGSYEVDVASHQAAVNDYETLFASVLIHSYALTESAAADHLGIDSREFKGIEDWGTRLLGAEGRDWSEVMDQLPGAVEVAVVRNALAHGTWQIDAAAERRLLAVGPTTRASGSPVTLDYKTLQEYRARLRSLLRYGGIKR
jgi:hypothetical protein